MKTDSRVIEDLRFVKGEGNYADDVKLPDMLHLAVFKSPYAHAKITSIDTSKAERIPGVKAIATGVDAKRMTDTLPYALRRLDGKVFRYCLAADKVRYFGEPVVAVAAADRYAAMDALDSIAVEFEPLPVVPNAEAALRPGAPLLHEALGSNIAYHDTFDFADGIDRVLEKCDGVLDGEFRTSRVTGQCLETFTSIAKYDPGAKTLTYWSSFQYPSNFFTGMNIPIPLRVEDVDINFMQNIDLGGSFGNKTTILWPTLTGMMSILAGKPVKFVETRTEHSLTGDAHAFDRTHEVKLGYMRDGTVRAIKLKMVEDIGAYPHIYTPASVIKPLPIINGQYKIPYAYYDVTCVFTNKSPVGAYRGLGAISGTFPLERMMDRLARALSMDPVDLRRKNLLAHSDFPYRNPSGNTYDSGNYETLLKMALDMCDYPALKKKCAEARANGRLMGIGLATSVVPGSGTSYSRMKPGKDDGGPASWQGETIKIRFGSDGKLHVSLLYPSSGQGHETIITELLSDTLGLDFENIIVERVMTVPSLTSAGPAADRETSMLTALSDIATQKIKENIVKLVAEASGSSPSDYAYEDGFVVSKVGPSKRLSLSEAMKTVTGQGLDPKHKGDADFSVSYKIEPPAPDEKRRVERYKTMTAAANVVLVEVDPGTGVVTPLNYWIAYDCGTILNKKSVEGQVIGSLAQGVEQALYSEFVYDTQGQLLNPSFLDYLVIRSNEMPELALANIETPSPRTHLGVKGIGEGTILWAPPALANAVEDAVNHLGVSVNEIPMRPSDLFHQMNKS